jgi:glycosyltransferase involved in cell wall biosynthesis
MDATIDLVAFDATPLEAGHWSGISWYTAYLLDALLAQRGSRRYALLAGRSLDSRTVPAADERVGMRFPSRFLWMQLVLPVTLGRLRPALCHFTNSVAPLWTRRPSVLTIHDMTVFLYPETQSPKQLAATLPLIRRAARTAAAIVTDSESARHDIISRLDVPPERVHVTYGAAGPQFRVIDDETELERVRRKYGLHEPYILAVGTIEPRKNHERLIDACIRLRRQGRREHLVLVGNPGWRAGSLLRRIAGSDLSRWVRVLGYVRSEDLTALYNLARTVAMPSLYEGFGLPILEGMACGVPVVTSNRASMAEIAGEAAVLTDPMDVDALSDALERAVGDDRLRETLRTKGLARAAQFSWARTAQATGRVYDRVLGRA